jgi:hypothetical protein
MKKAKRIAAIVGIVLIVAMYIVTLISSFFVTKYTNALFIASLFATFVVPVLIYAFLLINKLVNKKDNTIYLDKLKHLGDQNSPENQGAASPKPEIEDQDLNP